MTTAVDDDQMLGRNPCRIKGADNEHTPERPVLTVAQVFELAELLGRRPVGNVRGLGSGVFRLRYQDLILHNEIAEDGPWVSLTVYFHPAEST